MMMHRYGGVTRDLDEKAHGDLNYVWTQNDTHQPTLYHIAKIEDVKIVGAEI